MAAAKATGVEVAKETQTNKRRWPESPEPEEADRGCLQALAWWRKPLQRKHLGGRWQFALWCFVDRQLRQWLSNAAGKLRLGG